jgi:hypothetical protein
MSDQKDKWEMPKPVFRSSTGELPKTLQKTISGYNMPKMNVTDPDDDGDILSVHEHPPGDVPRSDGNEILETAVRIPAVQSGAAHKTAPTAVQAKTQPVQVSAANAQPKKRTGVGSFILIFLLIAALAAGLVYALMYYLKQTSSTGPF